MTARPSAMKLGIAATTLVIVSLAIGAKPPVPAAPTLPHFQLVSAGANAWLVDTESGRTWTVQDTDFGPAKRTSTDADRNGAGRFEIVAAGDRAFLFDVESGQVWDSQSHDFRQAKRAPY